MYCKNCGKPLEDDAVYCDECEAIRHERESGPNAGREGRGLGLGSTLLGAIGIHFAFMFLTMAGDAGVKDFLPFLIATLIVCPFFALFGLTLGILAISKAKSVVRKGFRRPVATQVLGIIGTALSAFILLVMLFAILLALSLM